jgi:Icc protein
MTSATGSPRPQPLRLLQFTDLHLAPGPEGTVRGMATHGSFLRCLEHARCHHYPADALLLTGDLVQDDARAYGALAGMLSGEGVPVHCLPGNHDVTGEMGGAFGRAPFDLSPVARYGPWTLLLLDSATPGVHAGTLSSQALERLDDALARSSGTHALVVLHHQPVPIGSAWLDAIGLQDGKAFMALLRRHGHVRGVLWGHIHQAFDAVQDGIVMMGTPSTCFQFVPGDDFAVDTRPPGYRRLQLHPDGRIESAVVWVAEEPGSCAG